MNLAKIIIMSVPVIKIDSSQILDLIKVSKSQICENLNIQKLPDLQYMIVFSIFPRPFI